MKNSDESEMRPEYDFSKAQRSRYASRLSDQNRRDILRRSAALDAQVYFARALQLVQELEAVVVAYLILAFGQSLEGAEHGTIALLEGRDRILLSRLSPAMNGDEDFVTRFNDLMVERNWLVHKGALELSPDIEEPSSLANVVSRLEALTDQAAAFTAELTNSLHSRLAEAGLTLQEAKQKTEETIHRWRAA